MMRSYRRASVEALSKIKKMNSDEADSLSEEEQQDKKEGASKTKKAAPVKKTKPNTKHLITQSTHGSPRSGSRHLNRKTFPIKLFDMLESGKFKNAIDYAPGGESIVVKNIKNLEEALPKADLNQSKLRSFHRQLSFWGFVRIAGGKSTFEGKRAKEWSPEEWAHPDFKKGMPRECLHLVVRVGAPAREKNKAAQRNRMSNTNSPAEAPEEPKLAEEEEAVPETAPTSASAIVSPCRSNKAKDAEDQDMEEVSELLLESDDAEIVNIMDSSGALDNLEDDEENHPSSGKKLEEAPHAKKHQVVRRISFHTNELDAPNEKMEDESFLDEIVPPTCLDRGESAFSFISAIGDDGELHDFLHPLGIDTAGGWDDDACFGLHDSGLHRIEIINV
mmetsp:Transcript_70130/g.203382  ORF Transcript_70130/g.203382 Transcript_70130/m.203382 type:complete len:390 (+) Transcript_70130:71-1240(+)